jgi:hypothetical protein
MVQKKIITTRKMASQRRYVGTHENVQEARGT